MERWNELVAGYVLENLTDEESRELSEILKNNPQLQLEISRLRKTATMSRAQRAEWPVESAAAGAEGWTDTVEVDQLLSAAPKIRPAFPQKQPLLESVAESARVEDNSAALRAPVQRFVMAKDAFLQRTSLMSWLVALMLVVLGLDNWRVRRLLAITQERVLQLELSAEYQSGGVEEMGTR
ncbi:MAG: hypothetical protein AAF810_17965 [Cyanobacteria bacterium P01_D01_bin.36]